MIANAVKPPKIESMRGMEIAPEVIDSLDEDLIPSCILVVVEWKHPILAEVENYSVHRREIAE